MKRFCAPAHLTEANIIHTVTEWVAELLFFYGKEYYFFDILFSVAYN